MADLAAGDIEQRDLHGRELGESTLDDAGRGAAESGFVQVDITPIDLGPGTLASHGAGVVQQQEGSQIGLHGLTLAHEHMRVAHPNPVEVSGAHLSHAHIAFLGPLDAEHALHIILQLAAGAFHIGRQCRIRDGGEQLQKTAGVLTSIALGDLLPGNLLLVLFHLIFLGSGIQLVHDALAQSLEFILGQLPDIIVLGAVTGEIIRPVFSARAVAGIAGHAQGIAASVVGRRAILAVLAIFLTVFTVLAVSFLLAVFSLILLTRLFAGLSTFGLLSYSLRNRAIGRVIVLALAVGGILVTTGAIAITRLAFAAAAAACLPLVSFSLEQLGKIVGSTLQDLDAKFLAVLRAAGVHGQVKVRQHSLILLFEPGAGVDGDPVWPPSSLDIAEAGVDEVQEFLAGGAGLLVQSGQVSGALIHQDQRHLVAGQLVNDDVLDPPILHDIQHVLGNLAQQLVRDTLPGHHGNVLLHDILDILEVTAVDVLNLMSQKGLEDTHPLIAGKLRTEEIVLHANRDILPVRERRIPSRNL